MRLQDSFTEPCLIILIENLLATLIDSLDSLTESNDSKVLQMWFPEPESTSQSLQLRGWLRYFETVAVRLYSQSCFEQVSMILRQISGLLLY